MASSNKIKEQYEKHEKVCGRDVFLFFSPKKEI
jgi:hypothetical protein